MKSLVRTLLASVILVPLATIASVLPASAHVEGSAAAAGGGLTTITLNVEHGCNDLPLTGLRVQLPAGATKVTAENPAGWTSTVTNTEVDWTGGSQPAHEAIDMTFSVALAEAAGATVSFPTIESCPGAEIAWIEGPAADGSESEHPAPTITVPEGDTSTTAQVTTTTAATSHSTATMAPEQTPITQQGSTTHNAGLVVLLVVMAIIIGGAVILYLRNRRPKPDAKP